MEKQSKKVEAINQCANNVGGKQKEGVVKGIAQQRIVEKDNVVIILKCYSMNSRTKVPQNFLKPNGFSKK